LPTAAALAALALTAAACGGGASGLGRPGGDGNAAPGADVTVVAKDVAFVRPPSTMLAGELRVALVNQGWAEHDLTFEPPGRTVAAARGRSTDAGTVALEPGTYTVHCSVQGHRQAGMEFTVEVT
jgi:plastocyanin